jgi:hypothetical protein
MKNTIRSSIFALTVLASLAGAQQPLPPVRPLGPVLATSTEPLASVSQVRALPGGRVIVHDLTGRRVLLFDSTFKNFTVIADSTSATGNAYGSRLGGLVQFRGDSTLFIDPQSISMLVIDGNGKIVRTMAVPLPNEVNALIGGQNGTPGLDLQGRLVYRAQLRVAQNLIRPPVNGVPQMPAFPESSFVVRVDLKSRKVDTAATFRIPKITMNMTRDENTGNIQITSTVNPMPWTDDWAMLADGTIAVIRGQDYRVDLVSPDGKMTVGQKLPFDWQRMTDEDKTAVIDSARVVMEKQRQTMMTQMLGSSGGDAKASGADSGKTSTRQRPVGDGNTMQMNIGGRGATGAGMGISMPPLNFVTLSEMPDYRPAIRQGASRGDAEGNLWIRTSKSVNGGTVYDVISNTGELKDRVLVPPGRVIAGFGPGGVVYMGVVDGTITHLERARVK